jgi:hypothetical protein
MSRLVETKDLRPGEMFALPNGSVYVAVGQSGPEDMPQGRLWCAHRPEPLSFEASVVDFATTPTVQLLEGDEVDAHRGHEGYVETLFRREMDRRHAENMHAFGERARRVAAEERRHAKAIRPWWKQLFR